MAYCYKALYRFTLYLMTLDTGLSFGKISSSIPLGDPEVKVIDLKAFVYYYVDRIWTFLHDVNFFQCKPNPSSSLLPKYRDLQDKVTF